MRFLLSIIFILSFQCLFAQAPQAIGFQGVAYGPDSEPLRDQNIQVKTEILESSSTGLTVYSENHQVTTNTNGLYDLKIGRGTVELGEFSNVDWAQGNKFLKVSLSMDGVEFYNAGITEFLSVPYALVAGSAEPSQKIFVAYNPHEDFKDINFINDSNGGEFKYLYQWVDGTPQDVLIEIDGLPDGICMEVSGFSTSGINHSIKEPIINSSNVDTIRGGLLKPTTRFIKCDPNATIAAGTYNLTYNFKVGEKVLKTLPVKMNVDPILYADCFSEFPLTLNLDSNNCDPNEITVLDQITIAAGTSFEASITSPFDGENVELNTSYLDCFFYSPQIELPSDQFNDSNVGFRLEDEVVTFEIDYSTVDFEYGSCEITYKK